MSDLKNQEQLRNEIGELLELSRYSWKAKNKADDKEDEADGPYPRSVLFKALGKHPALSVATLASVWLLGPARFSAMTIAGISLFARHRTAILPIVQQVMSLTSSNTKKAKEESSKTTDSYNNNPATLRNTESSIHATDLTRQ